MNLLAFEARNWNQEIVAIDNYLLDLVIRDVFSTAHKIETANQTFDISTIVLPLSEA